MVDFYENLQFLCQATIVFKCCTTNIFLFQLLCLFFFYLSEVNMRLLGFNAEDVPKKRKCRWSWWKVRRILSVEQIYDN